MAFGRNRSLPPSLWTTEKLARLPVDVKFTAVTLHMFANDDGRAPCTPWARRKMFDDLPQEEFEEHLLKLAETSWLTLYQDEDGAEVYQISEWPSVSHKKGKDYIPPPPADRRRAAGDSPEVRRVEEREGEREREEGEGEDAGPPTSRFCPRHRPNGVNRPCRDCGTARLAMDEYWERHEAGTEETDDG